MNKDRQILIAIVGMPGSGKSTAAEFFKGLGLKTVYFGGITIDTVKERGLEVNEENERVVREELRAKEGMAVMAMRSLTKIDALLNRVNGVVIDDLYSFDEYKVIHDKYGDILHVIGIVSPRAERHARLEKRSARPLNRDESLSRDFAQIEKLDIGGSIAIADHYINNNSTLEEFSDKLQRLVGEIGL